MEKQVPSSNRTRLSPTVIVICTLTVFFFMILGFLLIYRMILIPSRSMDQATRFLEKGNYQDALRVLEKAEERSGVHADLLAEKGRVWLVLAWDQQNKTHWRDYGKDEKDWLKSTEAENAEFFFKQALELDPKHENALYFSGILYMEKGWFSLAESEFISLLRVNNKHAKAHINLGVIYTHQQRYHLASQEFHIAYSLDPSEPSIAKNLAFLYRYYLQQPDSAIIWSNRYLNKNTGTDHSISIIRNDLIELLRRYPEFTPDEPMEWNKPRRFKSRFPIK